MTGAIYDRIGRGYATQRQPDPRVARALADALGDARTVVNVGAGTGSYEPADRRVVAVEPSAVMVSQRRDEAAPVVRGVAEALPFRDGAFDAATAILTIHHWSDPARGLRECARVARRVVLLTWDPESEGFWLVRDYFPDIVEIDRAAFLSVAQIRAALGAVDVRPRPVPADCVDGFLGAYWRRPEMYLRSEVRAGMSVFARLQGVDERMEALRADLASGAWEKRNGGLRSMDTLDIGYRIVIARS